MFLKELRESFVCLKIINKKSYLKGAEKLKKGLTESNELISIFVKSVETAQNNLKKGVRNICLDIHILLLNQGE